MQASINIGTKSLQYIEQTYKHILLPLLLYIPIVVLLLLYLASPMLVRPAPDPFLPGCKPHAAIYVLEITLSKKRYKPIEVRMEYDTLSKY